LGDACGNGLVVRGAVDGFGCGQLQGMRAKPDALNAMPGLSEGKMDVLIEGMSRIWFLFK